MDARAEIARAIDNYRDKVVALSHEIHEHPELRFEEVFAAGLLTKAAAELGLEVEREVAGMKTAFRAEFGGKGPTVAILAEYDALPNGHSCGHNLIAGAALSAVAGLKSIAKLPGRIVFLGTPAEEGGGGKIILIENGALRGVDAAMMAHPTDAEFCTMPALATAASQADVSRTRRARGAGAVGRFERAGRGDPDFPERRCDAAASARRIAAPRHHHRRRSGGEYHPRASGMPVPGAREDQQICQGDRRAGDSMRRGGRDGDRDARRAVVEGGYKNLINNLSMAHRYAAHSEALGVKSREAPENTPTGSTDMGDVSHVMPAIHPSFAISRHGEGNCHEDAFVAHADSKRGYDAMIRVAKAMAMTAYDLLAEPELLASAKKEFQARKES